MTTAVLNRRGRKRKSGKRSPSGNLVAKPAVDYRAMAAKWPHRKSLPEAVRSDERGESHLGRLNLIWRTHGARNASGGLSKRGRGAHSGIPDENNGISDDQYEAGRRYAVIVGAYLAMAGSPHTTAGSGRGYICIGSLNCPPETCICLARTQKYTRANNAIARTAGRKAHIAVNQIAIHDQPITPDQLKPLRTGLSTLAKHFGLTGKR